MLRKVLVIASLIAGPVLLAGCAMGPSQFGGDSAAPSLAEATPGDAALAKAHRSGLGLGSPASSVDPAGVEVSLHSSTKAPKGALADRDYSATRLDPELALKLINDYRAGKGLAALKLDARLTQAAKALSKDLASTDRISHYGSDGSSPWDRIQRTGYAAKVAAENVGTGQATLEEVFKGWEESPGHNRNLLLPAARDMGIALAEDPKTEFKTFWTLVVASSQ